MDDFTLNLVQFFIHYRKVLKINTQVYGRIDLRLHWVGGEASYQLWQRDKFSRSSKLYHSHLSSREKKTFRQHVRTDFSHEIFYCFPQTRESWLTNELLSPFRLTCFNYFFMLLFLHWVNGKEVTRGSRSASSSSYLSLLSNFNVDFWEIKAKKLLKLLFINIKHPGPLFLLQTRRHLGTSTKFFQQWFSFA